MRVIARFSKSPQLKYISHLDLLRLFQRALRRADIPLGYSIGFNPHMLISFACALPVGVSSDAEYIDIELDKDVDPDLLKMRLNAVLPIGIRIIGAVALEKTFPSLTAITVLSDYTIELQGLSTISNLNERLEAFLAQPEIVIDKKTKSGIKPVNIRPMIHRLKADNNIIFVKLTAGNAENLRVDVFWNTLKAFLALDAYPQMARKSLYIKHDGKVFEPIGEETP